MCFGSLSCWKWCLSGKIFWMNGTNAISRISPYCLYVTIPVSTTIAFAQCLHTAAYACILGTRFSFGFSLQACSFFLTQILLWWSTWTDNLSPQFIYSIASLSVIIFLHQLRCFSLFAKQIRWHFRHPKSSFLHALL